MSDLHRTGALVALFATIVLYASVGQASSLPDPTKPPSATQARSTVSPASRFSLDSILVGDERRRAVINGRTLSQGSRLGGARVLRIGVDRVLIETGGEQYTLELESAPSIRR